MTGNHLYQEGSLIIGFLLLVCMLARLQKDYHMDLHKIFTVGRSLANIKQILFWK